MRNPYYFNFSWLSAIIILLALFILDPCNCFSFQSTIQARIENIFIGIFSSEILLLLIEFINFFIDKRKYGFLKSRYFKERITQVNKNRTRFEQVQNRTQEESENTIKFINGSIYHDLTYYSLESIKYFTDLKYHYHGIYTGTVEYYDKRDEVSGLIIKTKAQITLTLNPANKMTGTGNFKYIDKDDFGKFEFLIDENTDRIIVSYVNIIPSGLSEGYEIWAKAE